MTMRVVFALHILSEKWIMVARITDFTFPQPTEVLIFRCRNLLCRVLHKILDILSSNTNLAPAVAGHIHNGKISWVLWSSSFPPKITFHWIPVVAVEILNSILHCLCMLLCPWNSLSYSNSLLWKPTTLARLITASRGGSLSLRDREFAECTKIEFQLQILL